jgi:hypothetical protein
LFVAAGMLAATTASAQTVSIGPRLGVSIDPDQFVVGGQMHFGPVADNLFVSPDLELGFGDDLTTIQINVDLHYVFAPNNQLHPYVGGGIGFAFYEFDNGGNGNDDSETEVGANIVGGLRFMTSGRTSHFFTELRLGLGDIPDLKIMGGWNFAM